MSQGDLIEWSPDGTVAGAGWRICLFKSWDIHNDDWYYYYDDDDQFITTRSPTTMNVATTTREMSTTTTGYPFRSVGAIVFSTDEQGEYSLCFNNLEVQEAVVHAASVASSVEVSTTQVTTTVSPCEKMLVVSTSRGESDCCIRNWVSR